MNSTGVKHCQKCDRWELDKAGVKQWKKAPPCFKLDASITVTLEDCPDCRRKPKKFHKEQMKRLAPGIYVDDQEQCHFDIPELLKHFGWPDTQANRDKVCEMCRDVISQIMPGATVIDDDPRRN